MEHQTHSHKSMKCFWAWKISSFKFFSCNIPSSKYPLQEATTTIAKQFCLVKEFWGFKVIECWSLYIYLCGVGEDFVCFQKLPILRADYVLLNWIDDPVMDGFKITRICRLDGWYNVYEIAFIEFQPSNDNEKFFPRFHSKKKLFLLIFKKFFTHINIPHTFTRVGKLQSIYVKISTAQCLFYYVMLLQ